LTIDIKKETNDSKLPAFSREGDACMDCYADKDVTIPGFSIYSGLGRALVPLGFRIALPKGMEALIRPRSGLALKEGLTILNSPGTIDENYRGEVGAIVVNTTAQSYTVKRGDRICQLAIRQIMCSSKSPIEWNVVPELDKTNRGEGGFGSSGKN
jgi:dUTP pyrophosphatase